MGTAEVIWSLRKGGGRGMNEKSFKMLPLGNCRSGSMKILNNNNCYLKIIVTTSGISLLTIPVTTLTAYLNGALTR